MTMDGNQHYYWLMERRARNAYVWGLVIAFFAFGYGMILGLFKMFRSPTVWYGYDIPMGLLLVAMGILAVLFIVTAAIGLGIAFVVTIVFIFSIMAGCLP